MLSYACTSIKNVLLAGPHQRAESAQNVIITPAGETLSASGGMASAPAQKTDCAWVDNQFEASRSPHQHIGRFGALENLPDINSGLAPDVYVTGRRSLSIRRR